MHIIITTEIYGLTKYIKQLANKLVAIDTTVQILDPYLGMNKHFDNEAQAYQAFIDECGHANYTLLIKAEIDAIDDDIVVVGFSAGASSVYKALNSAKNRAKAETANSKIKHFIGFYPSQIRYHLDVMPTCPVTLILPCVEKHFDLEQVVDCLSTIPVVRCIQTAFYHGFMNPLSANYDHKAAQRLTDLLTQKSLLLDIAGFRHLASH